MTAKIVAFDTKILSGPGEPARFNHVEVKVTNGVAALSVDVAVTKHHTTQTTIIHPESDAAIELAIALLNGAYHVQHGIHAGEFHSPEAFEHVGTAKEVLNAWSKGQKITPRRH